MPGSSAAMVGMVTGAAGMVVVRIRLVMVGPRSVDRADEVGTATVAVVVVAAVVAMGLTGGATDYCSYSTAPMYIVW